MADDLDTLLRAAMKTLDEQVPSGYFEALPNRTLARLEGSMQHGSSGTPQTSGRDQVAPSAIAAAALEPDTAPVMKSPASIAHAHAHREEEREEDSGLHDIRNLAQSTKQRLSKRSITSQPIPDDVLAASSGAFKNIALPQPAKMVSLPSVDELPSKAEVAAAEKAAKKAARESKKEIASTAKAAAVEAPAVAAAVPARQAFSLPSQQRKGGKGPLIALVGVGLAAAAGYVIFMQVQKDESKSAGVAASEPAAKADTATVTGAGSAAATVTAQPIVEAVPAAAPPVEAPKEEAAAGAAQLATDDVKAAEEKATDKEDEGKASPKGNKKKPSKGGKTKIEKEEPPKKEETKPAEKVEIKKPVATKGGGEAEGEPSFDALLKEAGVSDSQKKDTKPKLDKKSLNRDDFNKGISGAAGKAKSCYKGTQGTAMMKLTIAPSGSVSKVTVSGDFAGKPEGSCVENAIKAASFPPWDGGPQSFTYSVLLSD